MSHLTSGGAVILAVTSVGMMLFVMNAHNSALVRWGALIIAAAAVGTLALSYHRLARAHEDRVGRKTD